MKKELFRNPKYSNLTSFLQSTSQIIIDDEIINRYGNMINTSQIDMVKEIFKIIEETYIFNSEKAPKFSRTNKEIIRSNILTGCADYAIIFATILRSNNIPTIILQAAHIDWIKTVNNKEKEPIHGHNFLEIFINNKWYLLDPTRGFLYLDYDKNNFNLPGNYYVFAKSLDLWETGSIDEAHNSIVMRETFKDFDLNNIKSVNYKLIDLRK